MGGLVMLLYMWMCILLWMCSQWHAVLLLIDWINFMYIRTHFINTGHTMFQSVVILCSTIILFHGVSSHLHPKQILELTSSVLPHKNFKRQSFNLNGVCFVNQLRDRSPTCFNRLASSGTSDPIRALFRPLCSTDCGQVVLDSLDNCGLGSAEVNIFADLCGTNANGVRCYTLLDEISELAADTNGACANSGSCSNTCQSLLTQLVEQQGCCLDVFIDYARTLAGGSNPRELLNICNIDTPTGCNNSPFTATDMPTTGTTSSMPTDTTSSAAMPTDSTNSNDMSTGRKSASTTFFQVSYWALLSALVLATMLG